jgi:hypothetical protein
MRHVCATYPNLLARDPGALRANAASLVALLGEGEEHVRALLIKEPGLLSYNMMTLATRWSYVMQVGLGSWGLHVVVWGFRCKQSLISRWGSVAQGAGMA